MTPKETAVPRAFICYRLSPEEVENLKKPMEGSGGFQSFLRRVQRNRKGDILTVTEEDFAWLVERPHHIIDDKSGGWQNQLPQAFKEHALHAWANT